MSLAKKWLQRRIAIATTMMRHSGPMFDIINAVGDLPIEDDDPAAFGKGTEPPRVHLPTTMIRPPSSPCGQHNDSR